MKSCYFKDFYKSRVKLRSVHQELQQRTYDIFTVLNTWAIHKVETRSIIHWMNNIAPHFAKYRQGQGEEREWGIRVDYPNNELAEFTCFLFEHGAWENPTCKISNFVSEK